MNRDENQLFLRLPVMKLTWVAREICGGNGGKPARHRTDPDGKQESQHSVNIGFSDFSGRRTGIGIRPSGGDFFGQPERRDFLPYEIFSLQAETPHGP